MRHRPLLTLLLALPLLALRAQAQLTSARELGTSANAFSSTRMEQNQVFAHDGTNTVGFIHRNHPTYFGGSSGHLRYDLSRNGGQNWINDQGEVNPLLLQTCRFPQALAFMPPGETAADSLRVLWFAPAQNAAADRWDGYATGVCRITSPDSGTENYVFQGKKGHLPGGLCQGQPGVFWAVAQRTDGAASPLTLDSMVVYRGEWNPAMMDVEWEIAHVLHMPHNRSFSGQPYLDAVNMAFSPDGMTGWISAVGDLVGGHDSLYQPLLARSSDGGATWGPFQEVDLEAFPTLLDSINLYEVLDSASGTWVPAGTGKPMTGFEADLVVDANGNPHFFTVLGNGQDYGLQVSLWKGAYDLTSTDGGTTWQLHFISPVLAARGAFGHDGPPGYAFIYMDNYPQVSRNEAGTHVFFSWTDTDTTFTGFQSPDNISPDLHMAALRIADGYRTCNHILTVDDLLFNGAILWPSMAPTVLSNGAGIGSADSCFRMPLLFTRMSAPTDQYLFVTFFYMGNDATFSNSDFVDPASLGGGWYAPCSRTSCITLGQLTPSGTSAEGLAAWPNPASDQLHFAPPSAGRWSCQLLDAQGRVAAKAGGHSTHAGQAQSLDLPRLPHGVYHLVVNTSEGTVSQRIIVGQ